MTRLILAIVAFVLAMSVLKMIIIALILAGLIFRTKETIGLLVILTILALIRTYPAITLGSLAAIALVSFLYKKRGEAMARAIDDPDQE
jgi:hypothetical protein